MCETKEFEVVEKILTILRSEVEKTAEKRRVAIRDKNFPAALALRAEHHTALRILEKVSEAADVADTVAALDAIGGGDPESAHGRADDVILAAVPREVRDAYQRVIDRQDWWAAAC